MKDNHFMMNSDAHDLPEEVYQTTLLIMQKDANTVISVINSLFIEKITEDIVFRQSL